MARLAGLSLLLLLLQGCVFPYPHSKVYEGKEISAASLNWLKAGETSRAQVNERLGEPNIEFAEQGASAYLWSGQSGGVLIIVPDTAGTIPMTMRRALLIRYDNNDMVADYTFVGRPVEALPYDFETDSLDEKYDNWRYILAHWLAQNEGKRATGKKQRNDH